MSYKDAIRKKFYKYSVFSICFGFLFFLTTFYFSSLPFDFSKVIEATCVFSAVCISFLLMVASMKVPEKKVNKDSNDV